MTKPSTTMRPNPAISSAKTKLAAQLVKLWAKQDRIAAELATEEKAWTAAVPPEWRAEIRQHALRIRSTGDSVQRDPAAEFATAIVFPEPDGKVSE